MASGIAASLAKKIFLKTLAGLRVGCLETVRPEDTYCFGDSQHPLHAVVAVHDERFFLHALLAGDVGIGEAYMDGDWSTPDLVAVVRLAVRNLDQLDNSNRLLRRSAESRICSLTGATGTHNPAAAAISRITTTLETSSTACSWTAI